MRWPFVRYSRHQRELNAVYFELDKTRDAMYDAREEAAKWRLEYRKIRDRIVDIAMHPDATPQIRATLAEFAGYRP